jgi:hypothetical protein
MWFIQSMTKEVNKCASTGLKPFTLTRNQLTLLRAKPEEYQLQVGAAIAALTVTKACS